MIYEDCKKVSRGFGSKLAITQVVWTAWLPEDGAEFEGSGASPMIQNVVSWR